MKKIYSLLFFLVSMFIIAFCSGNTAFAAKLPAPQIKEVTSTENEIKITWTSVYGAAGYKIYMVGKSGEFEGLISTSKTEYTVRNLKSDKAYKFRIRAYEKGENKTKVFGEYTKAFRKTTKLPDITGLSFLRSSTNSISVKWKAVEGASSYDVYYRSPAWNSYKAVRGIKNTAYKIKNLDGKTAYRVKVIARSENNKSDFSDVKIFYTTPIKASTPQFVSNTAESVTLKWNPVGKANLYSVYVSSEKDGTYKRVAQIKGTQYTYIKKTPNTAYFFRIAAVIKNSEQSVLGEKSEALKASVGNLKITVPEKIRKGEYPEIKVPGYDDKVSWYSTNRDVIRYRNDRLYAVGSGETTLTAVYKKGKASVKVTVLPSPVSCMAAVYDVTNDKYIFERDINAKAYPASITKLITALVTLEHMSVDDIIIVGNELNMVEPLSSRCNIQRGEKFRLGDILYGLLLPSGGDAAYTIAVNCARKVSGKPNMGYVDAKNYFVKMMNEYVKSIGGTGTHCVNPHGYPVDNHYSSVHDLVLIGRKVLENPTLKKITSTSYRYVTSLTGQGHSWSTTNSLIINGAYYYSPYAHGMKTGTVDDYYTGIMSAATKDGRTIITVAIGCKSYNARYNATHALYDAYL